MVDKRKIYQSMIKKLSERTIRTNDKLTMPKKIQITKKLMNETSQ